ncbi:MAG: cation:proton antiporter, partial [Actinobacteria bacterium]|nr:cation:proton antiporter [Actinomycetota bacterium]
MNVEHVLIEILVLLAAAFAAAEVSQRIGVPTVVGEIIAGLAIGPSGLGLIS